MTPFGIASKMTADGVLSPGGKERWNAGSVRSILTNEKYRGDALLQKSYTVDFLTKKKKFNEGEIPQYSDSPERALVEVMIDTNQSGKELQELLTRLTRSFDEIKGEINDSIELRVAFDYFRQIPPPPPPPKPNDIDKGE